MTFVYLQHSNIRMKLQAKGNIRKPKLELGRRKIFCGAVFHGASSPQNEHSNVLSRRRKTTDNPRPSISRCSLTSWGYYLWWRTSVCSWHIQRQKGCHCKAKLWKNMRYVDGISQQRFQTDFKETEWVGGGFKVGWWASSARPVLNASQIWN